MKLPLLRISSLFLLAVAAGPVGCDGGVDEMSGVVQSPPVDTIAIDRKYLGRRLKTGEYVVPPNKLHFGKPRFTRGKSPARVNEIEGAPFKVLTAYDMSGNGLTLSVDEEIEEKHTILVNLPDYKEWRSVRWKGTCSLTLYDSLNLQGTSRSFQPNAETTRSFESDTFTFLSLSMTCDDKYGAVFAEFLSDNYNESLPYNYFWATPTDLDIVDSAFNGNLDPESVWLNYSVFSGEPEGWVYLVLLDGASRPLTTLDLWEVLDPPVSESVAKFRPYVGELPSCGSPRGCYETSSCSGQPSTYSDSIQGCNDRDSSVVSYCTLQANCVKASDGSAP